MTKKDNSDAIVWILVAVGILLALSQGQLFAIFSSDLSPLLFEFS